MLAWMMMMGLIGLICIGSVVYLAARVRRFGPIQRLSQKRRALSWLIGFVLVLVPAAALCLLWTPLNMAVCLLHLTLFWLLSDLVFALIRRLRHAAFKRYWAGLAALIVSVAWLTMGWVQANCVWQKNYTISTDKQVGSLRVALLSDSHMGTTFHAEGFARHLQRVQAQQPDVVVMVGDFVDESTTHADMMAACQALGQLDAPYGVYFVFGNHDKNNYAGEGRAYTGEELTAALEENGVTVLEDETVLIDDRFYLIGRQDASEAAEHRGGRASMTELTQNLDKSKFSIVLDHQPRDYASQAASGVDLVLSGHTHGGQLIPLVQLMKIPGMSGDNNVYGLQSRDQTRFIVSSGISDWELLFKTGCRSEYVIIDIQGAS